MRKLLLLTVICISGILFIPSTTAQDEVKDFSGHSARIYRAQNGRTLTARSANPAGQIVRGFLRANGHSDETLNTLRPGKENHVARTGLTHLQYEQEVAGLKVYGTYVKASINNSGELINLIENLAPASPAGVVSAGINARAALTAVLRNYYPGLNRSYQEAETSGQTTYFQNDDFFSTRPAVTVVAVPMASGALHQGFLVETWDRNNILRHTVVSGNGRILVEQLRTNNDSYNIFPDHPGNSIQTVVSGPGIGNLQSPSGWVSGNTTIGNNVDAYLDRDNNNAPDANGRPVSTSQNFTASANLSFEPTDTTNQMVAVQNLFYLNNVIHDKLYKHGFTEAAGNFQTNNFGKGGAGNDPVNAEAQDGGGTNNANFSTPADGSRPRMQMYLWTRSSPARDGDLDSDIVWHEYGHGLTWRMIGNMSGPLAGAIGEGMSDVLAILINNDDTVGEYSYNTENGIRRYRYTNYPLTYGNVSGSSVHSDGEIYAATIWYLWGLWQQNNLSQDLLFDYLVGGMNFTPSQPSYEQMRDGILMSIGSSTKPEYCLVWEAFAHFGIGVGASGSVKGGGPFGGGKVSITESFVVPSECSGGGGNTAPTVSITSPANNASFSEGASITFTGTASDTEDGNLTSNLSWTSSLDGNIGTGGSVSIATLRVGTHTITASVTDSGGLTGSASIKVTITSTGGGGITLSATGYKVKGLQKVDLTWSGASGPVDIYRNGEIIANPVSGSSYTDNINQKGAGTYNYRVCEAGGTSTCSNTVTVIF